MYYDLQKRVYVIIGTVFGLGYDCKTNTVKKFEGKSDGIWNKVSHWVGWIKEKLAEYDEPTCSADF